MIPGDNVGSRQKVMLRIPLLPADRLGTDDRLRTFGISPRHRGFTNGAIVRHSERLG